MTEPTTAPMHTGHQAGSAQPAITVQREGDHCTGRFTAMASPCEILIDSTDQELCRTLTQIAAAEAWRIERKFSRYRNDNLMAQINQSAGKTIQVDAETARLLDFAAQCHQLSAGLFDITSGILRNAWPFDDTLKQPDQQVIDQCLQHIGWQRLRWESPRLTLQPGMALDLGGIGKEYAVDRVADMLRAHTAVGALVNFGGDIRVSTPRCRNRPWLVGVENPAHLDSAALMIEFRKGGMATSGDTRRFIEVNGTRYGHILNPFTGWPIENAPRSVTVLAATCTEAGLLATLAMLQGNHAEAFLHQQGATHWIYR